MTDIIKEIKEQMIKAASRAYRIGLQTGNGGNLSCRIPGTEKIIIKASGLSFGECDVGNFVTVNLRGELVEGGGKPSRELPTHLAAYRCRPDICGIFHSHSPWSISYAENAAKIPLLTDHSKSKLGPVPVIRMEGPGTRLFAEAVEKLLKKKPELNALVQARHGIFAFGKDIVQAEHNAELIEETAQIAMLVALRKAI